VRLFSGARSNGISSTCSTGPTCSGSAAILCPAENRGVERTNRQSYEFRKDEYVVFEPRIKVLERSPWTRRSRVRGGERDVGIPVYFGVFHYNGPEEGAAGRMRCTA